MTGLRTGTEREARVDGPVSVSLSAAGLKTDVATLAPLITGKLTVDLPGSVSKDQISLDEGTLRSDAIGSVFECLQSLDASTSVATVLNDIASSAVSND